MGKRILVAYTTNAGSTTEVAEAIAKTLGQGGSRRNSVSSGAMSEVI